jgi:hypothetical protein
MYAEYFPLLALATYRKVMSGTEAATTGAARSASESNLGEA